MLCQKQNKVSQDPARAAVARYARNGACLVCVCLVCVCVCVCVCVFSVCVCVFSVRV